MSKIVWDQVGEKFYETGVRNAVLYPVDEQGTYEGTGVAWNGITSVTEKPTGAEATALYADDVKYLSLVAREDFEASIEAYTYPDAFAECDGSAEIATGVIIGQQPRKMFGLCYRTTLGNDIQNNKYGYKLHIIYNCLAAPSERSYSTINDSPEAITFSWELKTTPMNVTGGEPTSCITIDSTKVDAAKLKNLEDMLYGTADAEPKLPTPDEIAAIFAAA